jgi:thiol-disulfide isomerase/thioredoxin
MFSKTHEAQLKATMVYVIDMISKEVDAIVRLEDDKGKEVALDDDEGGFTNARIVFKCPKDGVYRVICTSFPSNKEDQGLGSYTLIIRKANSKERLKAFPQETLIGKAAPDVNGDFSVNGAPKKLSDLKGKVVLLHFWAVWCEPCIQSFPSLRAFSKNYHKAGLETLGLTTYFEVFAFDKETGKAFTNAEARDKDTPPIKLTPAEEQTMVREFAGHHALGHQLLVTTRGGWQQAFKDYYVKEIPAIVLIDRQGIVRMIRTAAEMGRFEVLHEEIKKVLAEK